MEYRRGRERKTRDIHTATTCVLDLARVSDYAMLIRLLG